MAIIKPFKAIRPRADLTEKISALPYDVYSRAEAYELMKDDKLSFLRIDRPETQFAPGVDMYAPEVYEKAHELLWGMVKNGEFVQDNEACYYLYELTMNGRAQTGLVACSSVDDYQNNVIKKHENTRADKEADRINHVDYCDAQTGPIFLAYRYQEQLQKLLFSYKEKTPVFDFVADTDIRHRGWIIDKKSDIDAITAYFAEIPATYIADGHHRAASAVKVSLKRREANPDAPEQEYDYFLSVLFADSDLMIMDYNRYVKNLNGLSEETFLAKVSEKCNVEKLDKLEKPATKGCVSMYLKGNWYALTFRDEIKVDDPVEGLDVAILQNEILAPVLGIADPKTNTRISFVGGIRGLKELERLVDGKGGVAFAMYPTSMAELFAVADAGLLMPPKSTWFEPKLRSGLFIHALSK